MKFDSAFLVLIGGSPELLVAAVKLPDFLGGTFNLENPLTSAAARW